MPKIPFVGRRFTPETFTEYLKTIRFKGTFVPQFVTLHHTGAPSLAQRPTGFEPQHLTNLLHYYQNQLGWSGAPHFFIDDRSDGIIVFQDLTKRGVHAASFNRISWGIEMLGNFDMEPFHTGRGAKVRDLSMQTLAICCKHLGVTADSIRFHRDDPQTSKSCPGRGVDKADVVRRVSTLLAAPTPPDLDETDEMQNWKVILPGGAIHDEVRTKDGRPIALARLMLDQLSPGGTFKLNPQKTELSWTSRNVVHKLRIAEIDENGRSWAFVRDLATAAGFALTVNQRVITIR
ncbi:MAG: peptidoglycan recognition family protein [Fimbriimonadaceae bacterium]|nr:peptidoglycan recognition family protein [Fimbriimonadaceae bacterium]